MFPILSIALQPVHETDRQKLDQALQKLKTEDPSIGVEAHDERGIAIVSGRGEMHLEIIVGRLKREFDVQVHVGPPRVVHKETLTRTADGEMKYAKQTGGRGQYGHVKIHVYPAEPGTGFTFRNGIVNGTIPNEFIAPIEEGIREAGKQGVLAGHPVDDVRVELYDGSFHEVDSSATAFFNAGWLAFQDAAAKANPVLLEPVMRVEVTMPAEHYDDVLGDLVKRRGKIRSREEWGGARIVIALIPLTEMLGYATDLRKQTSGHGTYVMGFDHYQPVQHTEGDVDRDSLVGAPRKPVQPLRSSRIALPEPGDDDADDDLQQVR